MFVQGTERPATQIVLSFRSLVVLQLSLTRETHGQALLGIVAVKLYVAFSYFSSPTED